MIDSRNRDNDRGSLRRWRLGALVVGALLLTGSARAATISYSDSYGFASTDWGGGSSPDGSVTLTLDKFDPSLGTLSSVTLECVAELNATWGIENKDAQAKDYTGNITATVTFELPSGFFDQSSVAPQAQASQAVSLGSFDGVVDYSGTSGATISGITASGSESPTNPVLSMFLASLGDTTFDLLVGATASTSTTGGGSVSEYYLTQAKGTATVTYTYVPVPESGLTPWLIGLGAIGFVRFRRFGFRARTCPSGEVPRFRNRKRECPPKSNP